MKIQTTTRTLAAALVLVASTVILTGCGNIGNENPISPEKMEQIRQKQNAERGSFKPNGGAPPANGSTTGQ